MKRLFLVLFAFVFAACTNDPDPADKDLTLDVRQADSLTTSQLPFTYLLTAQSDGKPLAEADVFVQENAAARESIGKTRSDGTITFTETELSGAMGEWTKYTFSASKAGHKTATVTRHLKFEMGLAISVVDTTIAAPGDEVGISIVVTAGAVGTTDVTLHVKDHRSGFTTPVPTTNGAGIYNYQVPFAGSADYRFTITAVKPGFTPASRDFVIRSVAPVRKLAGFGMTSLNSTSIALTWDPIPDYDQDYAINVYNGATFVRSWSGLDTRAVIDGLQPGIVYTFRALVDGVETEYGNWATAKRLPFETNGTQTIRLWEIAAEDATTGAGLIISPNGLRVVNTQSSESHLVDVVLGSDFIDPTIPIYLVSPGVQGSGIVVGKTTRFATPFLITGGLDKDFYTASVAGLFNDNFNSVDILQNGTPEQYSLVIPTLLEDENDVKSYARIEIVPQATGQLFGRSGQFYFVDLKVSYQTLKNTGYVGRPRLHKAESVRRSTRAK